MFVAGNEVEAIVNDGLILSQVMAWRAETVKGKTVLLNGAARPEFHDKWTDTAQYDHYGPDEGEFVADKIFTAHPVPTLKGRYPEASDDARRITDSTLSSLLTSDAGKFPTVTITSVMRSGWELRLFGLGMIQHAFLSKYADPNTPFLMEQERQELARLLRRTREVFLLNTASSSGNYGSYTTALASSARFDTVGGTNPMVTIDTYRRSITRAGGIRPNLMVIDDETYYALRHNDAMLAYVAAGRSNEGVSVSRLSIAQLGDMFELNLEVVFSWYEDGAGNTQNMWPKGTCLLAYQDNYSSRDTTDRIPQRNAQSALVNYYLDAIGPGMAVDSYKVGTDVRAGDRIDMFFVQDPRVQRPRRAHLLTSVIAP